MNQTKPIGIAGLLISLFPILAWGLYLGQSVLNPNYDWLFWMFVLVPATLIWFLVYGIFLLVRWIKWAKINRLIDQLSKKIGIAYIFCLLIHSVVAVEYLISVRWLRELVSSLHLVGLLGVILLPPVFELFYWRKARRKM